MLFTHVFTHLYYESGETNNAFKNICLINVDYDNISLLYLKVPFEDTNCFFVVCFFGGGGLKSNFPLIACHLLSFLEGNI